jgi:hypothetical protein
MNARYKALLPIAAVALIGLAGSSAVFAQAQTPVRPSGPVAANGPPGPPPFKCDPTEKMFKDGNGTNDNFAGTADLKPHPSTALSAPPRSLVPATNIYDQTASNYHFGDTFMLNHPGQITKIRLTTRLKANSGDASNDGISFSTIPAFTPGHFSFALPSWAAGNKLFWFDFVANSALLVNGTAVAALIVPANFYTGLNSNPLHELHVYVQDDTSVDFIQIEGCYKPAPPKYNLVASKKHDGSVYILNVHNAGQQIMPTGKVEVTEVVPAGFIAASSNLPPIILKTEGKSDCPNCMRVKLFLKSVSGGVKPVEEGNMKNNASCTM